MMDHDGISLGNAKYGTRENAGVHAGKICPACKKGKLTDLGGSLYECDKCGKEIYANEMVKTGRGLEMKEWAKENSSLSKTDLQEYVKKAHGYLQDLGEEKIKSSKDDAMDYVYGQLPSKLTHDEKELVLKEAMRNWP